MYFYNSQDSAYRDILSYIRNSSRVTTEASLPTTSVLPVNADAGYVGIPQVG